MPPHVTAIPLGRPLPGASSNQPGRQPGDGLGQAWLSQDGPRRPYSILLPVGLAMPPTLPPARCALTAPFHPYPAPVTRAGRSAFCGAFPGVAPAGRYPAPCLRGARTFLRSRGGRPAGWRLAIPHYRGEGNAKRGETGRNQACGTHLACAARIRPEPAGAPDRANRTGADSGPPPWGRRWPSSDCPKALRPGAPRLR